ncbi:MAG: division/cell wall cluster transcriptional repressor MraZ [Chloroflexi bacterium]|nr:division/cell wall cluster transcriptional repressor MraZ [Chloroflexota bacterium]
MFIGEFEYRLDEAGRVPLPPSFRGDLKEGAVLTAGLDKCIAGYHLSEWKKLAASLTSSLTRDKLRRLNRAVFASAFNLHLDGQGRITLPSALRQHGGLEDEVVIIGANNYFEIWDKKAWQAEKDSSQEQAWQIMESLEGR